MGVDNLYTLEERQADSAAWLDNFSRVPLPKSPVLPSDMSVDDMPNDSVRLKELIDEFQFQLDLMRGVNRALHKHIVRNHMWMTSGARRLTTDPLDTSLEE